MFALYKKHSNELYNKLVELSRNKLFYQEIKLKDEFETRALLIFFHLAIIFKTGKKGKNKKEFQNVFDNVFKNIEVNIRELGYGDTKVNKTMKMLSKIFYDIIYVLDKDNFSFKNDIVLISKYFSSSKKEDSEKSKKLAKYLYEFENFCFDLDVDNVLKDFINFKYRL